MEGGWAIFDEERMSWGEEVTDRQISSSLDFIRIPEFIKFRANRVRSEFFRDFISSVQVRPTIYTTSMLVQVGKKFPRHHLSNTWGMLLNISFSKKEHEIVISLIRDKR